MHLFLQPLLLLLLSPAAAQYTDQNFSIIPDYLKPYDSFLSAHSVYSVNTPRVDQLHGKTSDLLSFHQALIEIGVQERDSELSSTISLIDAYVKNLGFSTSITNVARSSHTLGVFGHEALELDPYNSTGTSNLYIRKNPDAVPKVLLVSHIGDTSARLDPYALPFSSLPGTVPYKLGVDKIYGSGSASFKSIIASQFISMSQLIESGKVSADDVAMVVLAGDGTSTIPAESFYTRHFNASLVQAVIHGEPTDNNLVSKLSGLIIGVLKSRGKCGHAALVDADFKPFSPGRTAPVSSQRSPTYKSASSTLLDALLMLSKKFSWHSEGSKIPAMNIMDLRTGATEDTVPCEANATIAIRVPKNFPAAVSTIRKIVDSIPEVSMIFRRAYPLQQLESTLKGFTKSVFSGISDSHAFHSKSSSIKRIMYGPGNPANIGKPSEHITKTSLIQAVIDYETIILDILDTEA
ncbi:hypothetical protein CANCADRAFT_45780 [Tortispora caseinolytica NRRL Y-17796]|uniref:Peptidase M20 dimerisation domain-containing protein n=1 Tax=Tortispora caseinolytica NRRL Y-17796 TaxID=767744 RepID=A0A1E4TCH1_9ASCO|nr:hypothetical protein CANCADRAFT_45780 [Tortispora caseinolytica NRRL Y-17796]